MKPWHRKVGLYMLIGCGVFLISSYARAQDVMVTDQYKTVINQKPYLVKVHRSNYWREADLRKFVIS